MKSIQKNAKRYLLVLLAVMSPVITFAQNSIPPSQDSSGRLVNPIDADNIQELIKNVLEGAVKIGVPFLALAIIYSGFLFVQARGNSEAIQKAKESLLYTVIGAAILLGAWSIAQIISETVQAL